MKLNLFLSLSDKTGIRDFLHNLTNSSPFPATCTNSPSARSNPAANRLTKYIDILDKSNTINRILRYSL